MIRKVGKDKYKVESESGKPMGEYKSEGEAKHRLKQIHFFKTLKAHPNLLAKLRKAKKG